jgi:hypothetical protein
MADEYPHCGIWSDWYRAVECIVVASSAGGIEKGRRPVASRTVRQPEAGVGILLEAQCRRRRDAWVCYVAWQAHPDHVTSHDCSFQHTCSDLSSRLLDFVLGRCQNKAHHHLRRSSELVGAGGQGTPAGSYMDHMGLVATGMDGLRVDRTVGRWNSLTWSSCRLLTHVIIGLARGNVAFIERQRWVTALTLAPSTVPRSHVRRIRLRTIELDVSSSSSSHFRCAVAGVLEVRSELQAG